jgi:hypothetical protein
MASKTRRSGRRDRIKTIGSYQIHGRPNARRLTVSNDLQVEPVPVTLGRQWTVELVIPADGLPHIELHPVLEGDEADVDDATLRRRWRSSQEVQR